MSSPKKVVADPLGVTGLPFRDRGATVAVSTFEGKSKQRPAIPASMIGSNAKAPNMVPSPFAIAQAISLSSSSLPTPEPLPQSLAQPSESPAPAPPTEGDIALRVSMSQGSDTIAAAMLARSKRVQSTYVPSKAEDAQRGRSATTAANGFMNEVITSTIMLNVEVPMIDAKKKMRFATNSEIKEVLSVILRRVQIEQPERCALFLPSTGIWLQEGRTLQSYIIKNNDTIVMRMRDPSRVPRQVRVAVIGGVSAGVTIETIPWWSDTTTVWGLVQQISAKDPERAESFDLYLPPAPGERLERGRIVASVSAIVSSIADPVLIFKPQDLPFVEPDVSLTGDSLREQIEKTLADRVISGAIPVSAVPPATRPTSMNFNPAYLADKLLLRIMYPPYLEIGAESTMVRVEKLATVNDVLERIAIKVKVVSDNLTTGRFFLETESGTLVTDPIALCVQSNDTLVLKDKEKEKTNPFNYAKYRQEKAQREAAKAAEAAEAAAGGGTAGSRLSVSLTNSLNDAVAVATQKLRSLLPNRPTKRELENKHILPSSFVGLPDEAPIPLSAELIDKACRFLEEHKAEDQEGLFRISGNSLEVREIWKTFRSGAPTFSSTKLHEAAGALKLYLRELPEPLIPFKFFGPAMASQQISDDAARVAATRAWISKLPPPHFSSLKILFKYLTKVAANQAVNKMSPNNIGIVFGPSICRHPEDVMDMSNTPAQIELATLLVEHWAEIFETPAPAGEAETAAVAVTAESTESVTLANQDTAFTDAIHTLASAYYDEYKPGAAYQVLQRLGNETDAKSYFQTLDKQLLVDMVFGMCAALASWHQPSEEHVAGSETSDSDATTATASAVAEAKAEPVTVTTAEF